MGTQKTDSSLTWILQYEINDYLYADANECVFYVK